MDSTFSNFNGNLFLPSGINPGPKSKFSLNKGMNNVECPIELVVLLRTFIRIIASSLFAKIGVVAVFVSSDVESYIKESPVFGIKSSDCAVISNACCTEIPGRSDKETISLPEFTLSPKAVVYFEVFQLLLSHFSALITAPISAKSLVINPRKSLI